jgi:hypothetical protein
LQSFLSHLMAFRSSRVLTDMEVDNILKNFGKTVDENPFELPLNPYDKLILNQQKERNKITNPNFERDHLRVMAEYCLGLH